MDKRELSKLGRAAGRMLLALGFVFSQSAWAAQSQSVKEKPAPASNATGQQTPAKASPPAPATAENEEADSPTKKSARQGAASGGGPHEGIKVHGHWTIDVRNPDGSVVTHREFENSLASGSGGGAPLLAQILGRQYTVGAWEVLLESTKGSNTIIFDETGSILAPSSTAVCTSSPSTTGCSTNLTVTAAANGSLTFAGSAVIPPSFGAAVTYVETDSTLCLPSTTTQACPSTASVNAYTFTSRSLDGLNGDPAAVSVSPGQTVEVTVNITFS
jgi:hypothetical protein